jgi:hypothetical protein
MTFVTFPPPRVTPSKIKAFWDSSKNLCLCFCLHGGAVHTSSHIKIRNLLPGTDFDFRITPPTYSRHNNRPLFFKATLPGPVPQNVLEDLCTFFKPVLVLYDPVTSHESVMCIHIDFSACLTSK